MATHPAMSNELLNLWLRAGDGLPCDEARQLVEKLHLAEIEQGQAAEEASAEHQKELDSAVEEARTDAREEIVDKIRGVLENAAPANIIAHIEDILDGREPGHGQRERESSIRAVIGDRIMREAEGGDRKPATRLDHLRALGRNLQGYRPK